MFLATALVVVVVLGLALFLTRQRADTAADESIDRALQATKSAIDDAMEGRAQALELLTAGLARVPTYVSRIGEALRTDNRANLLDQADEFRQQTGAVWTLITDNVGVLKARTDRRDQFDEDLSGGALVGLALGGESTRGIWIDAGPEGDLLYQAVGVPIASPGQTALYGVLVAALPIDSALTTELKRHTASDIVFFSLDTLGLPHVAVSTLPREALEAAMPSTGWDSTGVEGGHLRWEVGGETLIGVAGPLTTASGVTVGQYVGFRSRDRELAVFTQLSQTIRYVFFGGIALALLSSALVARQITRPVQKLVDATRQVSEGQYSGTIEVRSRDEIGQLAAAFQKMLQDLREKQALLEFLSGAGSKTVVLTADQAAEITARVGPQGTRPLPAPGPTGMLVAGTVLANRYEIKKILGVGGMGVVYRAEDRELDEVVAIKTLKPEYVNLEPSSLERFKQEIRLARRITHRNVVRTHDLGEVDGMYYITMEFVEGTNLKELIRKRGYLPAGVAVTIGKQLCRALEVAHEQGVIHRDIKPQNIVVDAAGFLKVMDFGIARLAKSAQPDQAGLTQAGVAIGTPEYMAPEQLLGEELDVRADLYAAGAVLYECVTGHPPFNAPTVAALMVKHIEETPEDPRVSHPEIPEAVARVIMRAMAKQRETRWQSAVEMHAALDEA